MGSQKEYPVNFTARGLCDAWDATGAFPGACITLQNLIFDQGNSEQVVARPGVGTALTVFAGFTAPTFVSAQIAIGDTIYGMVSSALTAGKDQPFAFQIGVGFVAITGITGVNVPTSISSVGDWTPPQMAVVGTKVIVTHTGFSGAVGVFFGVIDITNPAAPTWAAANTATNLLPSVPTGVANFNNRAYFICGNKLFYSDVLVPTTMTNAGQSLTVGDPAVLTAMSGLPVQTSTAGVVSALIVFKASQVWQVVGDAAVAGSLSLNFMSLTIGCVSPRSVAQTPIGTIFIATDGPYSISATGTVMPLTKDTNRLVQDLQEPFQNIINPGRAAASYSSGIYRICLTTTIDGNTIVGDYWFDVTVRRWNGPHTFAYDAVSPVGNYFVLSGVATGAALYASQALPALNSVYVDGVAPITVVMETSLFPKTQNINMKQVVESTIEVNTQASGTTYTLEARDETFVTIDVASISTGASVPVRRWGDGGLWGGGNLWQTAFNPPSTKTIPWTKPLIFKKIGIKFSAQAASALSIGAFFAKYKDCGYTNK